MKEQLPKLLYKGIESSVSTKLLEGHMHVTGDTTDFARRIVFAAYDNELSTIIVTDHDSLKGYEVASKINDTYGLGLTIISGVESTARVELPHGEKQDRHVLVYGISEAPPAYLPPAALNQFAHEQGALTIAAHPTLGPFSFTKEELLKIQKKQDPTQCFDGIEIFNSGAALIDHVWDRFPGISKGLFVRDILPTCGSNIEAKILYENNVSHFPVVIGGSDAHRHQDVGNVVMMYPEVMDPLEALRAGQINIVQMKAARLSVENIIVGTVRGNLLDRKRRSGGTI